MIYVKYCPYKEIIARGHPSLVKATQATLRPERTTGYEAIDHLLRSFEYHFLKPSYFEVQSGTTDSSVGSGKQLRNHSSSICNSIYLLHIGFSLILPIDCAIQWARYVVELDDLPTLNKSTIEILDLLPNRIDSEVGFVGPIRIKNTGELHRDTAEIGKAGTMGTRFSPRLLGFRPHHNIACWDFLPYSGGSLHGTESLLTTLCGYLEQGLIVRQSLYLSVEIPDFDSVTLECPIEEVPINFAL